MMIEEENRLEMSDAAGLEANASTQLEKELKEMLTGVWVDALENGRRTGIQDSETK